MALLSRVAECLYWLGRYVERAENTARLLMVTHRTRFEPAAPAFEEGAQNPWEALILTLGRRAEYAAWGGDFSERSAVTFLAVAPDNPSSIAEALRTARENARTVRDFLSSETWVAINRAYRRVQTTPAAEIAGDGLHEFCDGVLTEANLFRGTAEATSLHDEGWHWLRAGLALERADMVTRIVDAKYHLLLRSLAEVGGPEDRFQWAALLRSVSGWEAYRRLYPTGIDPLTVTDFLLLNRQFPRSLASSMTSLREALTGATAAAPPALRNPPMQLVTALETRLQYESAEALVAAGLHETMDDIQKRLLQVGDRIGQGFFRWESDAL